MPEKFVDSRLGGVRGGKGREGGVKIFLKKTW